MSILATLCRELLTKGWKIKQRKKRYGFWGCFIDDVLPLITSPPAPFLAALYMAIEKQQPKLTLTLALLEEKGLDKVLSEASRSELATLLRCCEDLDTKCGSDDVKPMKPGLSRAEHQKRLGRLEQDCALFEQLLKTGWHALKTEEARAVLVEFGRLIYGFNAYQAPARSDPSAAVLDAYGLSDPYQEMLKRVTKVKTKVE